MKTCNDCRITKPLDAFDKRIDRGNRPMAYCKECRKVRQNKHNALPKSKEYNSKRGKAFYSENKEDQLEKSKAWRDSIRELYGVSYNTLRKRTDVQYKLKQNIRKRVRSCLIASIRTSVLIGCSPEEFKQYLESKFTSGMSWDNYGIGGWEIDHIVPLDAFNLEDEEELKKACHFSNTQPLWASDNRKKSAK